MTNTPFDPRTLLNRAFDESTEKPACLAIALVKIDSLSYINENFGKQIGDAFLRLLTLALIRRFGDAVYHLSGDKFVVTGSDTQTLNERLDRTRLFFPGFSFGVGTTIAGAEKALYEDQLYREYRGFRAPHGKCPYWLPSLRKTITAQQTKELL